MVRGGRGDKEKEGRTKGKGKMRDERSSKRKAFIRKSSYKWNHFKSWRQGSNIKNL